jgi:hypothetical protein
MTALAVLYLTYAFYNMILTLFTGTPFGHLLLHPRNHPMLRTAQWYNSNNRSHKQQRAINHEPYRCGGHIEDLGRHQIIAYNTPT